MSRWYVLSPQALFFLRDAKIFPLPKTLLTILLASIFISSSSIVYIGHLVRLSDTAPRPDDWTYLALGYVVACVLFAFSSGLRVYAATAIGEEIGAKLRVSLFSNFLSRPLSYFESERVGSLLAVIIADVTTIQTALRSSLTPLFRNALVLAGAVVMMFVTDAWLAVLVLGAVPILIGIIALMKGRQRTLAKVVAHRSGELAGHIGETLSAISTIKTLNREITELSSIAAFSTETVGISKRLALARAALLCVIILVASFGLAVILYAGHAAVASKTITSGVLSSFLFFLFIATASAATLNDLWASAIDTLLAVDRVVSHFEPELQKLSDHVEPVVRSSPKSIVFEDVSFSYSGRDNKPALDNISLHIAAGATVAFVGRSGAGKSTILKLLLGFIEPTAGRLLIDGTDIRLIDRTELRNWFAVVPQEPFIFSTTAYANIQYGRPGSNPDEVEAAARMSSVHLFAKDLPDGLNTHVGDRGSRLSGGQKQRVAIARAIIRDAPILVLDEPTSALDNLTGGVVQSMIFDKTSHRTTIIVSHSMATARSADRVIFIEGGRVKADGPHDRLVKESESYNMMMNFYGAS